MLRHRALQRSWLQAYVLGGQRISRRLVHDKGSSDGSSLVRKIYSETYSKHLTPDSEERTSRVLKSDSLNLRYHYSDDAKETNQKRSIVPSWSIKRLNENFSGEAQLDSKIAPGSAVSDGHNREGRVHAETSTPAATSEAIDLGRTAESETQEHQMPVQHRAQRPAGPQDTPAVTPFREEPQQREAGIGGKNDNVVTLPTGLKPNISLYEALFPEEAAKLNLEPKSPEPERQIPRLPVGPLFPQSSALKPKSTLEDSAPQSKYDLNSPQTVLVKYSAMSKNMSESDFRRVIPGGEHIEGWQHELGQFERVIPYREPHSLQRTEEYWLVFSSEQSAMAYNKEVQRLHKLSQIHTQTSLTSMIPPPPGFLIDGEDVHAKLQSYTLYPPSQMVDGVLATRPFPPTTKRYAEHQDLTALQRRDVQREHEVLIAVQGPQPNVLELREAIRRDGRSRGLDWALASGPDHGITQLTLARSIHGEVGVRAAEAAEAEDESEEDEGSGKFTLKTFNKWVIAFQSDREAKRFVRTWHQRPLPWARGESVYEEMPSIVSAELLWGA
ncbi:MAG: hypothetical protein M1820_010914 [Bogoriella megaspora]|nr:MAG: hypothetical protein M1820_010914 [Bogoriella megaspora]